MEKVYMAKLAVLMSAPRKLMMHWPFSPCLEAERAISWTRVVFPEGEGIGLLWDDPLQGLLRSDSCDPLSRASCSRVIGMKEPI